MKQFPFCFIMILLSFTQIDASSQTTASILLPTPQTEGGKPLLQTLKERKSSRAFSSDKLTMQILSNLLWAANGINRPELNKRTAPSAKNLQEIDIYVAAEEGLYLYDAHTNVLKTIKTEDIREATGTQSFVKIAPINLIFVADIGKAPAATEEEKVFYPAIDTGYISQNVYLYCASEGLATVARGLINRPELAKEIGLRSDQKIILTQSVGYPAK